MPDLALGNLAPGNLALGLETAVAVCLGGLGPLAAWRPRVAAPAAAAVGAVGVIGAVAFLLAGAAAGRFALPLGAPGAAIVLALDGLSGFFLLPVLLVGVAVVLATEDAVAWVAPLLGAALLVLLAGDGFALALGVAAMAALGAASVACGAAGPVARRAARRGHGFAMVAVLALIAVVALPDAVGSGFAVMRAQPPAGQRAVLLMVLALLAGFALPPRGGTVPVAAVLEGAGRAVAAYLLVRLLFDLAGPAQPVAWGVPLLALGAAAALLGGWRALAAGDMRAVLAAAGTAQFGLVAVGLGVALAARAEDLTTLAALALAGALLLVLVQALATALLVLAAGVVEREAGTQLLARLGGLAGGMPGVTLAVLGGALTLAALPPSGGFAGVWLLLQAVLETPRLGFLPLQMLAVLAAAALAAALGLLAAAMVRLVGVAFLGRPRTPRAAGAQEPPRAMRIALLALAGGGVVAGVFPGAVLALARPALLRVVGDGMAGRAGLFVVTAQTGAPGYAAAVAALLLGLAALLAWWLVRRFAAPGHRTAPAWDGGFGAPPPWLPFGDPLTQLDGAGFAGPFEAALGVTARVAAAPPGDPGPARILPRRRRPVAAGLQRAWRRLALGAAAVEALSVRATLALGLAVLVLLLAAFAVAGRV